MTQQEESANFFRLVRLLIDEGSDVLRDVLLKTIQPDTLTIFLRNNLTLINNLLKQRILVQDQYDLLTRSPAVQFDELDITLLCCIFRNLCHISPTNGWQTPPGPTDQGLGDDINRLRTIRNTIYGHKTSTRVTASEFNIMWTDLKDLIIRLSKHGTPTKQRKISVRITAMLFQGLYPESQTQKSAEILKTWKKLDDEKWDVISKRLEKHDDQLANQEERFVSQEDRLNKQEEQGKQFKVAEKQLKKELETHKHHLREHDERMGRIEHKVTCINKERESQNTSPMTEGKTDSTRKFPNDFKRISHLLYKVLEDIGASTEMRDFIGNLWTSVDIRETIIARLETENIRIIASSSNSRDRVRDGVSLYTCGSSFEITTTLGMMSDVDTLMVVEISQVVTDISDAQPYDFCFLMVQDFYTPPGYAKLQWVIYGVPDFRLPVEIEYRSDGESSHGPEKQTQENTTFAYDYEGRGVFIYNIGVGDGLIINGPARTTPATKSVAAVDKVIAVRCHKIPDCASEWFTRQRHYNWPTPEWIDQCKTLGCFFVYVGHPDSEERHLQWRMSFSLQERFLVTRFNSVQLKCFILMKIIKKDTIYKDVGEKSLTSYHCKTCLLYLIENNPAEFWREENLLYCLYTYLGQILRCVETMNCPNYFLPDENMFQGRLPGKIQIKLRTVLRKILDSDFQCLLELNTDDLGRRLQVANLFVVQHSSFLPDVCLRKNIFLAIYADELICLKNSMLRLSQSSHSAPAVAGESLNRTKLSLQNKDTLTDYTREQIQNALSPLCQYIDISRMSIKAVLAKSLHQSNAMNFRFLSSEKWHQISLKLDRFSPKLKQASLLYMMEFADASLDVLLNLQRSLRHQLSFCACSADRNSTCKFSAADLLSLVGNTPEELLEKCFIPCVIYLPAEKNLTPTAICYEMNRSLGFPDDDREYWYDWAIVDGKILLYFLLYLNHRHFDMEANAAADMENIKRLIETDEFLGHKETALNLLGWIYKERGRVDSAVERFRESLAIQPTHNAAFCHLRDIGNVLNVFLSSRFTVT